MPLTGPPTQPPMPPTPMEYPSASIERLYNGLIVTIHIPNSITVPPRFIVQTLEEACDIVRRYLFPE